MHKTAYDHYFEEMEKGADIGFLSHLASHAQHVLPMLQHGAAQVGHAVAKGVGHLGNAFSESRFAAAAAGKAHVFDKSTADVAGAVTRKATSVSPGVGKAIQVAGQAMAVPQKAMGAAMSAVTNPKQTLQAVRDAGPALKAIGNSEVTMGPRRRFAPVAAGHFDSMQSKEASLAVAACMEKLAVKFGPVSIGEGPSYDPKDHATIVRARGDLSRAKLMHGAPFRKLSPEAQNEILGAHDRYTKSIESAILAGHYPGGY